MNSDDSFALFGSHFGKLFLGLDYGLQLLVVGHDIQNPTPVKFGGGGGEGGRVWVGRGICICNRRTIKSAPLLRDGAAKKTYARYSTM